jgi:hypothetical protein
MHPYASCLAPQAGAAFGSNSRPMWLAISAVSSDTDFFMGLAFASLGMV